MSYRRRGSLLEAFSDVNLISAIAMMIFAFTGFVMTGIAGTMIEYMHTYQFLPLGLSFAALALAFFASETRDPRYYRTWETVFVLLVMAFMVAHAFLTQVQDIIAQYNPISGAAIIVMMILASAVVGR